MTWLRVSPLTPIGWAALALSLGLAGLAVVALRPSAPEAGPCRLEARHTLPSGRAARLCDILTERQPFTDEDWLVVRMVVPDLATPAGGAGHGDHDWVCARLGVPRSVDGTARIVVQLMEEPFPRGEPVPGITQSIEAYSLQDGACIWELF